MSFERMYESGLRLGRAVDVASLAACLGEEADRLVGPGRVVFDLRADGTIAFGPAPAAAALDAEECLLVERLVTLAHGPCRRLNEVERLQREGQRRAAELAIVASVQQGIAAELDFQAIVDLVGDKLREVLGLEDIGIRWRDLETGLVHYLYEYEHGVRMHVAPHLPGTLSQLVIESRRPVVLNTREEMAAVGARVIPDTDESLALLAVPIVVDDESLGSIILENYEREHAYGESDVRLVEAIAGSLGMALQNARLLDETQRLLRETEQHAAELSVIASIQHGIAAELDFQAIIELVGDKLRAVLRSDNLGIDWIDEGRQAFRSLYAYEHGVRLAPYEVPLDHPMSRLVQGAREAGRTVLVDDATRSSLAATVVVEAIGDVAFRGKAAAVPVYAVS